jgi:hypothetical protein
MVTVAWFLGLRHLILGLDTMDNSNKSANNGDVEDVEVGGVQNTNSNRNTEEATDGIAISLEENSGNTNSNSIINSNSNPNSKEGLLIQAGGATNSNSKSFKSDSSRSSTEDNVDSTIDSYDLLHLVFCWVWLGFISVITHAVKVWVGEHRPFFLSLCDFDWEKWALHYQASLNQADASVGNSNTLNF